MAPEALDADADMTLGALHHLARWARDRADTATSPTPRPAGAPADRRPAGARPGGVAGLSSPASGALPPRQALHPAARQPARPTLPLAALVAAGLFISGGPCAASPSSSTVATVRPLPTSMSASAPAEVLAALPAARLVGRGTLRFFGLSVYEARLWAAPGFDGARYDGQPFALELQYTRKLEGPAIAERSIAEMKRVGSFTAAQSKDWLALMTRAFPDVAAGDRLTGVHIGDGEVRFFHNGKATAALTDATFARLFFGIWLAPQTSAPALRQSLLGSAGTGQGG